MKFRAYNTIVKRFQFFTLQDIEKEKTPIQWHILIIDRFTGMKDKDGNDIYENDLVTVNEYSPVLKCEYSEKYAEFMFIDSDDMRHTKSENYNRTVKGNIHENSDLFVSCS